jgi:hypothetical protein
MVGFKPRQTSKHVLAGPAAAAAAASSSPAHPSRSAVPSRSASGITLEKLSAGAKRRHAQQLSVVDEDALQLNGGSAALDMPAPIHPATAYRNEEYEERKCHVAPPSRQSSAQRGRKRMRIEDGQPPPHALTLGEDDEEDVVSPATAASFATAAASAASALVNNSMNDIVAPPAEPFVSYTQEEAEIALRQAQLKAESQRLQARAQLLRRFRQAEEENRQLAQAESDERARLQKVAEAKAASDAKLAAFQRQLEQHRQ